MALPASVSPNSPEAIYHAILDLITAVGGSGAGLYAEDSVAASGDLLQLAGAVKQLSPTSLAANGDRTNITVDALNRLFTRAHIDRAGEASYSAFGSGYGGYASATDTLVLKNPNASGKVLRVHQMSMWMRQTTGALATFDFVRRTTLNTSGTATQPTVAKLDTNDGSPVGVVDLYSAAPTTGTGAVIATQILSVAALTSLPAQATLGGAFGRFADPTSFVKTLVLRPNESLALNFKGVSPASGFDAHWIVQWTEEDD